jgi:nicotinamidase-related amidase
VHCIEGTWGWEIHDAVAPTTADVLLRKYRRSAFVGTNLADLLHMLRVETIIVSGVAATGCVESTVRDAIERDFFVAVPADCIGDASPELVQQACTAFERMLLPGDLTTTGQLDATLGSIQRKP